MKVMLMNYVKNIKYAYNSSYYYNLVELKVYYSFILIEIYIL